MTQEIRNLVDDNLEVHVITAGLSDDSRFMQLKIIALDAIKRAKEAESKLATAVKALEEIKLMLDMDHSDYQKYLIWKKACDALLQEGESNADN